MATSFRLVSVLALLAAGAAVLLPLLQQLPH
jgi:hypothetical protein